MLGCATNQTGRPQGTRRFSHATKGEICDMNARSINQWLREERKRVGMTQAQVAGAAGMSRGYYNAPSQSIRYRGLLAASVASAATSLSVSLYLMLPTSLVIV